MEEYGLPEPITPNMELTVYRETINRLIRVMKEMDENMLDLMEEIHDLRESIRDPYIPS